MATLPFPARRPTLSEINADYLGYLSELEQGGAIVVVSDDEQSSRGVLTRDPAALGDAPLAPGIERGVPPRPPRPPAPAQLTPVIETGAVPPLDRLLDAPSEAPAV